MIGTFACVCVAGFAKVQDDRQIHLGGDGQLILQDLVLEFVRGGVPVVVQADLTDGYDARVTSELGESLAGVIIPGEGIGGMDTDSGAQQGRCGCQFKHGAGGSKVDGRDEDTGQAGINGALQDTCPIGIELVEIQVTMGICQGHGKVDQLSPAIFSPSCRMAWTLSPCMVSQ
jgi:hypothetical protein